MRHRRARTCARAVLCVVIAAATASPARGGDGAVIADSVAEFSSTQGLNNWRYGYYAVDGDHESFTELCCHDPAGAVGPWWERAPTQPPWNLIWSEGQHPDATWTVRRWIAEVTGLVRIDVTTDHWPAAPGATTVRVLSDGMVVYERVLPEASGGPLTESVFAVAVNGDYRLRGGSPCIDAANNAAVAPGRDDLDGNPRFVDDGCTPDTGTGPGGGPIVDMGAQEFQSSSCDLDGDAAVGITDLLALLGAWGPCPSPPESCPADFDHDGEVGIVDFLMLLADWGWPLLQAGRSPTIGLSNHRGAPCNCEEDP